MPVDQPVCVSNPMTRKRFLELISLANETCDFLKKKGLKTEEVCEFGRCVETLIRLG